MKTTECEPGQFLFTEYVGDKKIEYCTTIPPACVGNTQPKVEQM